MRNKLGIIVLTSIVTLLCLFYLSFTWVARNQQKEATEYATNSQGEISFSKRQAYLDSIYDKPVYNFLGSKYTYKEVKENELALGLDLQGGMYVLLEVSPVAILNALSGNSTDPAYQQAIQIANEKQKSSQENYTTLFFDAYRQIAGDGKLARIFANNSTKGRIDIKSSDSQVKKVVDDEVSSATDRSLQILRTRIDKFGVTSPNIQRIKGTGRIQVELPGVDNPQRVRNLLQGVAQLEFLDVYQIYEIAPYLKEINTYLLTQEKKEPKAESKTTTKASNDVQKLLSENTKDSLTEPKTDTATAATKATDSLATASADSAAKDSGDAQASILFRLLKTNDMLRYDVKDTAQINKIFGMPKVKAMLPNTVKFLWEKKPEKMSDNSETLELVPVRVDRSGKAQLTGEVIVDAREGVSEDGKSFEISMSMNSLGAKKWKRMTAEASKDPANKRRIAIVLDNIVYSAPYVQNEIPNGNSSITGKFTFEEAKDLASILKAGKMPAPTRIVEEAIVGPSLGKEAINQGLTSAVAGLVLVVMFMVFYYSKGGIVADLALLFNVFFIMGIMAQPGLGTVLTLPGIAGIVLTMGMSVDANVLIFERIREELRSGKSVTQAISMGYDKAFSSIFDSNITTLLSGIILLIFGSGPVKGFAITLIIGIITSFFSAVYVTRVIFEWMAKRNALSVKSFDTFLSRGLFKNLNFDFIGNRKKAYIFSAALILFGIGSIIYKGGLTLGVDFKGGRSYIVQFSQPVVPSDIKVKLTPYFKNAGTEVKAYGENTKVKITTSYLADDESEEADNKVAAALNGGLENYKDKNPQIQGSSKVGATVADDIKSTSAVSVGLALIAIFLYVMFRFQRWQFGLGGIVALAHDVLIAISAYGVAELIGHPFEVDQVFIAAILTVIGYSINDTVVVFDRIRETIALNPKLELEKAMNIAINETISRTIITATTVFIVSAVLFVFGGETLRGFSLVMLIGTTFGTYSSIFIATPIVVDLQSKAQLKEENKKETSKKEPAKV